MNQINKTCTNCPGSKDHNTSECPMMRKLTVALERIARIPGDSINYHPSHMSRIARRALGLTPEEALKLPDDSEEALEKWATGRFHSSSGRYLGQVYGNTDWALARAIHHDLFAHLQEKIDVLERLCQERFDEIAELRGAAARCVVNQVPYTPAIGEAGSQYHARFKHAHPLPSGWRWAELWDAMAAAATLSPAHIEDGEEVEVVEFDWPTYLSISNGWPEEVASLVEHLPSEPLMTVAQHQRIVAALQSEVSRLKVMADNYFAIATDRHLEIVSLKAEPALSVPPVAGVRHAITLCEQVLKYGSGGYTVNELVAAIHAHLNGRDHLDAMFFAPPASERQKATIKMRESTADEAINFDYFKLFEWAKILKLDFNGFCAIVESCVTAAPVPEQIEVATLLAGDPYDERDGCYLSIEDSQRLAALPAGTKLYVVAPPRPSPVEEQP